MENMWNAEQTPSCGPSFHTAKSESPPHPSLENVEQPPKWQNDQTTQPPHLGATETWNISNTILIQYEKNIESTRYFKNNTKEAVETINQSGEKQRRKVRLSP
jgi:hypothetical protein